MKANSNKCWWQIGIGGTDTNGISIVNIYETEFGIKRALVNLVKNDKNNDPDSWDYGTDKIKEIESRPDGSFYGYGCYVDYHIDYQAHPVSDEVINTMLSQL